jgi:hypothetical protein
MEQINLEDNQKVLKSGGGRGKESGGGRMNERHLQIILL